MFKPDKRPEWVIFDVPNKINRLKTLKKAVLVTISSIAILGATVNFKTEYTLKPNNELNVRLYSGEVHSQKAHKIDYQAYSVFIWLTDSSGTWTVPADWNNSNNKIHCIGGGGGGGGAGGGAGGGGGGGGGGYAYKTNASFSVGQSIPYNVGWGGDGGALQVAGTDGGDTAFGSVCQAIGGFGGQRSVDGGAGGSGGWADTGTGGFGGGNGGAHSGRRPGGGGGGAGGRFGDGFGGGIASGSDTGPGGAGGSADAGNGGAGGPGGVSSDGVVGDDGFELGDGSAGAGGGGGGAGQNSNGGWGGYYGGGGGGGGGGSTGAGIGGTGAPGLILVAYTPIVFTTTTLASSMNPGSVGQPITFTATVTTGATGTVTFRDSATVLGTISLSGNKAQLTTSSLSLGTHSIKATYNGDAVYAASNSAVLSQVIKVFGQPFKVIMT